MTSPSSRGWVLGLRKQVVDGKAPPQNAESHLLYDIAMALRRCKKPGRSRDATDVRTLMNKIETCALHFEAELEAQKAKRDKKARREAGAAGGSQPAVRKFVKPADIKAALVGANAVAVKMPTEYTNRIHCPKCQLKTAVSACTDDKWEEIKNSREKAFQARKANAKDDTKKTRRTKHANWWKTTMRTLRRQPDVPT